MIYKSKGCSIELSQYQGNYYVKKIHCFKSHIIL